MNLRKYAAICAAWWFSLGDVGAQSAAAIPVRTVRVDASTNTATLRSASFVREITGSRVLVNDATGRQLLLFSADLASMTRIADTTTTLPHSYGLKAKPSGLVAWRGDSMLFFDNDRLAVLVINPAGAVVDIIAPIKISDLNGLASGSFGPATTDGNGRLLYGAATPFDPYRKLPSIGGPPVIVAQPDSNVVVRADFQTRMVDTVATLRAPVQKIVISRRSNGAFDQQVAVNPIPLADDWTALPDGTIAIIRASDYHIDWVAPDGKKSSSPPMPFDWRPISPEEKRAIVDSTKRALQSAQSRSVSASGAPSGESQPEMSFTVDAADIPDAYPSVRARQTRADLEGRVWILPTATAAASAGLLYDVVDRSGKIVERVSLPTGRALVGFGKGNTLYLGATQRGIFALERAEVVR